MTAEDGATVLIYQITVTRAAGWLATLTVGVDNSYVPPPTGYTLWGTDIGGVSEQSFVVDVVPRCWHHPLRRWALPERVHVSR